eukprot:361758-Chlamydomonas_euryale.AAC.1
MSSKSGFRSEEPCMGHAAWQTLACSMADAGILLPFFDCFLIDSGCATKPIGAAVSYLGADDTYASRVRCSSAATQRGGTAAGTAHVQLSGAAAAGAQHAAASSASASHARGRRSRCGRGRISRPRASGGRWIAAPCGGASQKQAANTTPTSCHAPRVKPQDAPTSASCASNCRAVATQANAFLRKNCERDVCDRSAANLRGGGRCDLEECEVRHAARDGGYGG